MIRVFIVLALFFCAGRAAADTLPSWNDGPVKTAILAFIDAADDPDSPGHIPAAERVAVFDNDGTLWAEKPLYFQLYFALDRARALAETDPDFARTPALEAAAAGDVAAVMAGGEAALLEVVSATHSDMSIGEFQEQVAAWLNTARHPETGRAYTAMTYQPMRELLDHLRAHGFETYIVSGGGLDFMRVFAEEAYGVPPQNVIGSMGNASLQVVDGVPQVVKDEGIAFIDDKETKPVAIMRHIGRRPVFIAGNSDGDLAMAEWGTAGPGPRFALFVHHTDAEREWAYDRESPVGRLDLALDTAAREKWTVVDMARDWAVVFPSED